MGHDVIILGRSTLRSTDSNSLLRMYDLASGIFNKSQVQAARARAEKAMQSIAKELRKRNVQM